MVCFDSTFIIDVIRGEDSVLDLERRIDKANIGKNLPAPVVSEILRGMHLSPTPKEEKDVIINIINSSNILPLNKESSILAGEINSELMKDGQDIGLVDCMIAAIVIKNKEVLITRNKKHFEKIPGLKIETY